MFPRKSLKRFLSREKYILSDWETPKRVSHIHTNIIHPFGIQKFQSSSFPAEKISNNTFLFRQWKLVLVNKGKPWPSYARRGSVAEDDSCYCLRKSWCKWELPFLFESQDTNLDSSKREPREVRKMEDSECERKTWGVTSDEMRLSHPQLLGTQLFFKFLSI